MRLRPNYADAYTGMGVSLKELKRKDEAEHCFAQVVHLRPGCALSLGNLAGGQHLASHRAAWAEPQYWAGPCHVLPISVLLCLRSTPPCTGTQQTGSTARGCHPVALARRRCSVVRCCTLPGHVAQVIACAQGPSLGDTGCHQGPCAIDLTTHAMTTGRAPLLWVRWSCAARGGALVWRAVQAPLVGRVKDRSRSHPLPSPTCKQVCAAPLSRVMAPAAGVYYEQGKLNEAIQTYQEAISREPNFPEAYNNLGNALREAGRTEEAIACYTMCIQLQFARPQNAQLARAMQANPQMAAVQQAQRLGVAYNNLGGILKLQVGFQSCGAFVEVL